MKFFGIHTCSAILLLHFACSAYAGCSQHLNAQALFSSSSLSRTDSSELIACSSVFAVSMDVAQSKQSVYPKPKSQYVSPDPLGLLVHYIERSGKQVRIRLRDFQHVPANFGQSNELRSLASRPCGRGDVVRIESRFSGSATGSDAAGVGRFVWQLSGTFVSDGLVWSFSGNLRPAPDYYNFDPQPPGVRSFFGEVSTRIGSMLPGKPFRVQIDGAKSVRFGGPCAPGAGGSAIA